MFRGLITGTLVLLLASTLIANNKGTVTPQEFHGTYEELIPRKRN